MDILIKNGRVIDPAEGTDEIRDIFITEGRIASLPGDFNPTQTIDAEGLVVCPGFIDIHMHEDPVDDGVIYDDPVRSGAARLLRMGVTTALGGNCGENSHDPLDFLKLADSQGSYVNIALMAGQSYFRNLLTGTGCYDGLSSSDICKVSEALGEAVSGGCIGVSFGLEYYPGISLKELLGCAEACRNAGGRFISAHIRSCAEEVYDAEREILEVGKQTGLSVQLSHVGSMAAYGQMRKFLDIMDSCKAEGMDVYGDCYPYTAFCTHIGSAPYDDLEKMHCRYEDIIMCQGEYRGQRCTKEIFEAERRMHPDYLTIGEVMNAEDVLLAFRHQDIMLCSDLTMNRGFGHPRASGSFPRFLSRYVSEDGLSLSDALYKMTALPAKRLGLDRKGSLKPGCDADIVIFNPDTVSDRADFLNPLLDPVGIEYVLVGGNISLLHGELSNIKHGRAVRL